MTCPRCARDLLQLALDAQARALLAYWSPAPR